MLSDVREPNVLPVKGVLKQSRVTELLTDLGVTFGSGSRRDRIHKFYSKGGVWCTDSKRRAITDPDSIKNKKPAESNLSVQNLRVVNNGDHGPIEFELNTVVREYRISWEKALADLTELI